MKHAVIAIGSRPARSAEARTAASISAYRSGVQAPAGHQPSAWRPAMSSTRGPLAPIQIRVTRPS